MAEIVQKEQADLSNIYKNKPFDLPTYYRKRKSQINEESPRNQFDDNQTHALSSRMGKMNSLQEQIISAETKVLKKPDKKSKKKNGKMETSPKSINRITAQLHNERLHSEANKTRARNAKEDDTNT